MFRTYEELITLPTFEERFKYCDLFGKVGAETFGYDRWLMLNESDLARSYNKNLEDQFSVIGEERNLSKDIANDLVGKYGDNAIPITRRDVRTAVINAVESLASEDYSKMNMVRIREEFHRESILRDRDNDPKVRKLTDEEYLGADRDLYNVGQGKYSRLPAKTRNKLIVDYSDNRAKGFGYKDSIYEFEPRQSTKNYSTQNYYDQYMTLHPNSELTFNEFRQWYEGGS